MFKQNLNKRYQIPQKDHLQETNYIEMRHKALDYLKRHADHQVHHPAADVKKFLIKRNNQLLILSEDSCVLEKSNLFSQQIKNLQDKEENHHVKEVYHHMLPPIYNVKINKQERKSSSDRRSSVLKKKLDQQNNITLKESAKGEQTDHESHRRYHSIELKSYDEGVRVSKSRALSAYRKSMNRQKIKTHHEYQRNIYNLPVEQFLKQNKITIEQNESPVLHKMQPNYHKIRKPFKKDVELRIESESIKKTDINHILDLQSLEENKLITIYGIEPNKQLSHSHHKRFDPHVSQHKKQMFIKDKDAFQKFEFTPWESEKQQLPNILNLQIQNL